MNFANHCGRLGQQKKTCQAKAIPGDEVMQKCPESY
jgi:hypothetical protein